MGLASSCKTFEMLSAGMEGVASNKLNIHYKIHILNDFLIAAKSLDTCQTNPQRFLAFCEDVGVPTAPEKLRAPSRF